MPAVPRRPNQEIESVGGEFLQAPVFGRTSATGIVLHLAAPGRWIVTFGCDCYWLRGGSSLAVGDVNVDEDTAYAAASLECATAENYNLSGQPTLTVAIDGGSVQTVQFQDSDFSTPSAATAEEVTTAMSAALTGCSVTDTSGNTKVTITSSTEGVTSSVEVTGGTANTALGFSTTAVTGTGPELSHAALGGDRWVIEVRGEADAYLAVKTVSGGPEGPVVASLDKAA